MQHLLRDRLAFAGGVAAIIVATVAPLRAQPANPLPQGEGRELVTVACSQCHNLNVILSMRDGPNGWKRHVYNMVLRGAQLSPREVDTVLNYLNSNLGPGQSMPPAKPVALASGPGKELVETRCGLCHDLERITIVKRQKRDWDGIVANMFERFGLSAPEEARAVSAYLGEHYATD